MDDVSETDDGDGFFRDVAEQYRGVAAMAMVGLVCFSAGIAVMGMRTSDQVDDLQQARRTMEADISTNRSEIASLRSIIQQTDLASMAERVRRMDRELCLLRFDLGGSVTPQMQQECARR